MHEREPRDRGPVGPELVYGLHPVEELVQRRPREVERIYVARERTGGLGRLLREAREAGIPITHLERAVLARKLGARAVHQGVAAAVAALPYAEASALVQAAMARPRGLLVLLEGVTDTGNLGAVLRSAAAAGADGVLLGGEGTVGLLPGVLKASAGTAERVPVAREAHATRRIAGLRERGFAAVALVARGGVPWHGLDLGGPLVLVAGGEDRGLRPGIVRACSALATIPLARGVESLNVAVAVGVLLFEAVRQRRPGLETVETG
jgi:23S rRNA (guanosine2251-2'-O)-methyltransferase